MGEDEITFPYYSQKIYCCVHVYDPAIARSILYMKPFTPDDHLLQIIIFFLSEALKKERKEIQTTPKL